MRAKAQELKKLYKDVLFVVKYYDDTKKWSKLKIARSFLCARRRRGVNKKEFCKYEWMSMNNEDRANFVPSSEVKSFCYSVNDVRSRAILADKSLTAQLFRSFFSRDFYILQPNEFASETKRDEFVHFVRNNVGGGDYQAFKGMLW